MLFETRFNYKLSLERLINLDAPLTLLTGSDVKQGHFGGARFQPRPKLQLLIFSRMPAP